MFTLVKTPRAKFWHIRDTKIKETICGKTVTASWNIKIATNIPKNTCMDCSVNLPVVEEPALPEVTNKHSSWS